jgi:hypothetical protein
VYLEGTIDEGPNTQVCSNILTVGPRINITDII